MSDPSGRFLEFQIFVRTDEDEVKMFKRIFEAIHGKTNQTLVNVKIYDASPETIEAWKELRDLHEEENS